MTEQDPRDIQRRDALRVANQVRTLRADIRREIVKGDRDWADLLREPPEVLEGITVHAYLQWIPGISKKRALLVRRQGGISETVLLGKISPKTRERLVDGVHYYKPTYGMTEALAA